MKELAKQYDPSQVEDRIYQFWLDGGYFHTKADPDKKPYTIVMPPPNVTGQLHMGHAVDNTMQDILIRTKRMQGYAALWVPGTDHASIATEAKVVEAMRAEGLTKEMVGRDGFLERAWAWKTKYGNRIVSQLKKLGSSCDWERERFTMDEGCSEAVKEVFVRLYDKGLIYRGNRMVNWCPHCNTSISDAEVEYEEKDGSFWHLLYPVKETGEMLELATTRPETMLGDTAVAINGEDPRYAHLHGCHVVLPLLNKEIPIVCDEHADMTKGTGVVKITPAHDPNDFEVGLRHNLEVIRVIESTFYQPKETSSLEDASASAMVASLNDPASYYLPAAEYEEYKLTLTNQYIGIGVTTQYNENYGYLTVLSVTPGSPADQAHVKVGNMIASVDDIDVSTYTPEQFDDLLRSYDAKESETEKYFTLHLLNTQGGKADATMKCELIYAEPVVYYILDSDVNKSNRSSSIGYLRIRNFDDSAAASVRTAVASLQDSGATSLIIDVRDNTSGKPAEMADSLDFFLPKGDLFFLRDRDGKETTYSSGSSYLNMPMVILVNENTTCAAEVFACIMQQAGVTIVGRRTPGSAQSQVIIELSDGSAVRISKYEYLTPDKKSMADLGGVTPDIASYQIEDSDMDVQLEAAKDAVH